MVIVSIKSDIFSRFYKVMVIVSTKSDIFYRLFKEIVLQRELERYTIKLLVCNQN